MNAENTRIGIIGLGSMSSAIVRGFYYPWRNRSDPDYRQRTEPGETGEQLQGFGHSPGDYR